MLLNQFWAAHTHTSQEQIISRDVCGLLFPLAQFGKGCNLLLYDNMPLLKIPPFKNNFKDPFPLSAHALILTVMNKHSW